MERWRNRFMWVLMILAASMLPGADVECDCEDGEFEFNWPGIEFDDDDCDDCWDDDWDDCDDCRGCDDCGGYWYEFDYWDYYW